MRRADQAGLAEARPLKDTAAKAVHNPNLETVGYLCRRIWDISRISLQAAIPDVSVTSGQLGTLALIVSNPGITPSEICRARGFDKSTVTIALNYLTAKRLIRRRRSTADRRSFAIYMTPTGQEFWDSVIPAARSIHRRFMGVLSTTEKAALYELLTKIYERHCAPDGGWDPELDSFAGADRFRMPTLNKLGYMCRRISDAWMRQFTSAFPGLQLSEGRLGAIVLIACNPGITPTEIARANGRDKNTVKSALDDLVRQRLIVRRLSSTDRRSFTLHATQAGQRFFDEFWSRATAFDRELACDLNASERDRLMDYLQKVNEAEIDLAVD